MHMHRPIRDACFCDDDDDYYDVRVWVHVCIFHSMLDYFLWRVDCRTNNVPFTRIYTIHYVLCRMDGGWQMVTKFEYFASEYFYINFIVVFTFKVVYTVQRPHFSALRTFSLGHVHNFATKNRKKQIYAFLFSWKDLRYHVGIHIHWPFASPVNKWL